MFNKDKNNYSSESVDDEINKYDYITCTGIKYLDKKSKIISKKIFSIIKEIENLYRLLTALSNVSKDDNLYRLSTFIYKSGIIQLRNLKFVGVSDKINNFNIDFIKLVNSGQIVINNIDVTENCAKSTIKLIRKIVNSFEKIKKFSMKHLIESIIILKILNPNLQTGEMNLLKITKKKDLGMFIDLENMKFLSEELEKFWQLYKESIKIRKRYSHIKKTREHNSYIYNIAIKTINNYKIIRNTCNILPTQFSYIKNNLYKLKKIKKENSKVDFYIKNVENYENDVLNKNFYDDILTIKDFILETIQSLQINNDIINFIFLNEIEMEYPCAINKILNFIDFTDEIDTFNFPELFIDLEDKIKKCEEILKIAGQSENYKKEYTEFNVKKAIREAEKYFNPNKYSTKISLNGIKIEKILEDFQEKADGDTIIFLVLLFLLTEKLRNFLNEVTNYLSEINYICCKDLDIYCDTSILKKSKDFSEKIGNVTAAIGTIGCFASFAMAAMCPWVGWAIFGVCSLAFAFNLFNALNKS